MRVLVVDGHRRVRESLSNLLRRESTISDVQEARTRTEAIALVRESRPDVVVIEARLPDGSGIDACEELLAESPEARVVVLTALADERTEQRARAAGASAVLFKQLDIRSLLRAIDGEQTVWGDRPPFSGAR